MRKQINAIHENKVALKVKVPNLRDEYEKHIVLTVCDQEKSIQGLVEYIKELASSGHSFNIEVDPSDSEYHKSFYVDGDGADRIIDITVDEFEGR